MGGWVAVSFGLLIRIYWMPGRHFKDGFKASSKWKTSRSARWNSCCCCFMSGSNNCYFKRGSSGRWTGDCRFVMAAVFRCCYFYLHMQFFAPRLAFAAAPTPLYHYIPICHHRRQQHHHPRHQWCQRVEQRGVDSRVDINEPIRCTSGNIESYLCRERNTHSYGWGQKDSTGYKRVFLFYSKRSCFVLLAIAINMFARKKHVF